MHSLGPMVSQSTRIRAVSVSSVRVFAEGRRTKSFGIVILDEAHTRFFTPPSQPSAALLTWDRARSNLTCHERATSSDTPNHSVSVDRRGFRGVRLSLFLCGGSDRLDDCGGGLDGLCRTILALGRVHQRGPKTERLKLGPAVTQRRPYRGFP